MKKLIAAVVSVVCSVVLMGCSEKEAKQPAKDLKEVTENYTLEEAKGDGCLVIEDGDVTSGQKIFDAFVKRTGKGKDDEIRIVSYYTEDSYGNTTEEYPMMFVTDVVYENGEYTVQEYEEGELHTKAYKYLVKDTSNALQQTESKEMVYYILCDDEEVTWAKIIHVFLSAENVEPIDHFLLCRSYK